VLVVDGVLIAGALKGVIFVEGLLMDGTFTAGLLKIAVFVVGLLIDGVLIDAAVTDVVLVDGVLEGVGVFEEYGETCCAGPFEFAAPFP